MTPPLASVRLDDWLSRASTALAACAEQPRGEARRLVEAVMGWNAISQLADPDQSIDAASVARLDALVQRRCERKEPLSRILGRREFWGLDLNINGATLDPRADTETLVELALDLLRKPNRQPPRKILDLGTGSGALLLALLSEFPEASGVGVDQDAGTLATASGNASAFDLARRAEFRLSDWLSDLIHPSSELAGWAFDLIVSNPPYIPSAVLSRLDRTVRDFDDPQALDGGADGLKFYRQTLRDAQDCMSPGGLLILELGIGQASSVSALGKEYGWTIQAIRDDLAGIPRAMALTQP